LGLTCPGKRRMLNLSFNHFSRYAMDRFAPRAPPSVLKSRPILTGTLPSPPPVERCVAVS
jgi:hypothetical protein